MSCTARWRAPSASNRGDYRVLFTLEQNTMHIFGVRNSKEAYR
jgi:hypothetical protein